MSGIPLDAMSISDLARRRGVSKQAVHKRLKALEAEGRIALWPGPGRSVMVSAAAFDFAVGAVGDPTKEVAAESAAILRGDARLPAPPQQVAPATIVDETPAYRDAKARDAYYAAELKRLAYEREERLSYRVEEVDAAMVRIAGAVSSVTRGLVSRADEGAEAMERGMPAFRRWLVQLGDDICRSLAAEWRVVALDVADPQNAVDETAPAGDAIDVDADGGD
ncbi:winged helix-turn-helix domain-containing protein [Xanthobacter sediminis]